MSKISNQVGNLASRNLGENIQETTFPGMSFPHSHSMPISHTSFITLHTPTPCLSLTLPLSHSIAHTTLFTAHNLISLPLRHVADILISHPSLISNQLQIR